MTIKQQLTDAMKDAMRNKEKDKLTTIRMLIDRIQKKEKDLLRDLTEDEAVQVVQTFKKQVMEEMDGFLLAGNTEMFKKLSEQFNLVMDYLPRQMTKKQIQTVVVDVIEGLLGSGQVPNKGLVMKNLMPLVKGKADNKLVNEVVTETLK